MTAFEGTVSILPPTGPPIEAPARLQARQNRQVIDYQGTTIDTTREWRGDIEVRLTLAELVAGDRPLLTDRLSDLFWSLDRFRIACIGANHPPSEAIIHECSESHEADGSWHIAVGIIGTGPAPWPAFEATT